MSSPQPDPANDPAVLDHTRAEDTEGMEDTERSFGAPKGTGVCGIRLVVEPAEDCRLPSGDTAECHSAPRAEFTSSRSTKFNRVQWYSMKFNEFGLKK